MDHLREDRGDVVDDLAPDVVGQALPELPGSDGHTASPLLSRTKAISSATASHVSFVVGALGRGGARLVAATGIRSSMRSRYRTNAWPPPSARGGALTDTSAKRRPKSGCAGSVTSISTAFPSCGL
jgi:hypothetical protein